MKLLDRSSRLYFVHTVYDCVPLSEITIMIHNKEARITVYSVLNVVRKEYAYIHRQHM